jgi:hypothetical protein
MPPQLAAMLEARREDDAAAQSAAARERAQERALPATSWAEIRQRAASAGFEVILDETGQQLEVRVLAPSIGA